MGHTHLMRDISLAMDAVSEHGTWVDLIKVPAECLVKTEEGRTHLDQWLRTLMLDPGSLRTAEPAYADISLTTMEAFVSPQVVLFFDVIKMESLRLNFQSSIDVLPRRPWPSLSHP